MKALILIITVSIFAAVCGHAGDPYSFYPSEIYRMDEAVFQRSQELIEITPERPLVVKDKEGNVTMVNSSGESMVSIDSSGRKTFHIGGRKEHQRGEDGEIERSWEREEGDHNTVRIENERAEVLGYEEYAMGGNLVSEYDEQQNLIKSVEYDEFGKRSVMSIDEVTQTRTIYNDKGQRVKEIDFEGNEIARYEYDDSNRLVSKEDVYENITYFNDRGQKAETYNRDGRLIKTYNYTINDSGYEVLGSVKDEESKIVTYYENNRQVEAVDSAGNTVTEYNWIGTTLVYAEDMNTGEKTWFNNGRPSFSTNDGKTAREWFYDEGRLVGIWSEIDNTLEVHSYGRREMEIIMERRPELEDILGLRMMFRVNEFRR